MAHAVDDNPAPTLWDAVMNYQFGSTDGFRQGTIWWLSFTLSFIAVLFRLFARRCHGPMRSLKSDDYLLIASLVFFTGAMACGGVCIHLGMGLGRDVVFSRDPVGLLKAVYAGGLLGIVAIAMCKMSLGVLYWHLLREIRRLRWYAFANIIFCIVTLVGSVFWRIFACLPQISANWDLSRDDKNVDQQVSCTINNLYMLNGQYVITIISDVIFIVLAIPLLRRADLTKHEKLGVFAMFALTFLTIVASTIREVVMFKNRDLMLILTWGIVETALCIVVTSAIAMRALMNNVKKRVVGWAMRVPVLEVDESPREIVSRRNSSFARKSTDEDVETGADDREKVAELKEPSNNTIISLAISSK